MKDNSLDGHRGKVALSENPTTRNASCSSSGPALKCDLKEGGPNTTTATNFDDDYNEWELGIGDLIIDLDADIEKTNGGGPPDTPPNFAFLGGMSSKSSPRLGNGASFEHQATVDKGLKMKIKRKTVGSKYSEAKHEIVQSDTTKAAAAAANSSSSSSSSSAAAPSAVAATANSSSSSSSSNSNSSSAAENCSSASGGSGSNSTSASNSPAGGDGNKSSSKHSSSKGRNSSHREKKEKNRDKDKGGSSSANGRAAGTEVNGVLNVMSPLKLPSSSSISSPAPPSLSSNSSPLPPVASPGVTSASSRVANSPGGGASNCGGSVPSGDAPAPQQLQTAPPTSNLTAAAAATGSPPMPNLTLKLENGGKFATSPAPPSAPCVAAAAAQKVEERPGSPPLKKLKMDPAAPEGNDEGECPGSPSSPEMKDTSTCTSVGTITEPDCLGPCEPGTSVMLEGIVWQETEGGVLVVNVTWRGKTYVGTLLDCTKHDWAPPRFCESPTSDVDSKASKGRGKRGRGGGSASSEISFADTRNCVQSKLRNGKGRRTTVNSNAAAGFTVPSSPAKGGEKRKSGSQPPAEGKRSRSSQQRSSRASSPAEQPSSPQLITCPEPNCSKRYKHLNGLKYHRAHAHSGGGSDSAAKVDAADTDNSKDVNTNSSDNEEGSLQESASVSTSPAPSFANAVQPPPAKTLETSTTASSSSSSGLPDASAADTPFGDHLSTLASVAIGGEAVPSAEPQKTAPPQDVTPMDVVSDAALATSPSQAAEAAVSAVTTSVIQSSSSSSGMDTGHSIPQQPPHAIFSQGMLGPPNSASPSRNGLSSAAAPFPSGAPLLDKSKVKQERPVDNKYKPKSPSSSSSSATPANIRPIVPAPLIALSPAGLPPGGPAGMHCPGVNPALKPIQPKPTILGEPSTVNPALESLKKEKSKHKKKSSKDKERGCSSEKKQILPLTPTKLGLSPAEDCDGGALELTSSSYPSLEAVAHPSLSPLVAKGPEAASSVDMSLPPPAEDPLNENIQSPAYSDISDANDTAPVLESEVPAVGGREKEDKVGKSTPDAAQSPASASIGSAYGMYPYYSQPPYLLPSVSPQAPPDKAGGVLEPIGGSKKDPSSAKDGSSRPWSNPGVVDARERPQQPPQSHLDQQSAHHDMDKKQQQQAGREEGGVPHSPAVPIQDYPVPQHYPYPYGYVQGYPYSMETSSYHMHMLETDPHYKQQYKQYVDEHNRLYKEQQQQHHHQQQLQQMQQQQQQHQSSSHHGHHHSQHQSSSHHQSKSHHSVIKEERDRSRDGKDRGMSDKIQHGPSLGSSKEAPDVVREMEMRPPSLPPQARLDLKEKQNENHQILKENIELKSQMEESSSKTKANQYEMAMLFERHKEDMRRYYTYQDRIIEQQQSKLEPGIHHHTHHHQTIAPPSSHGGHPYGSSKKDDLHSKSSSSHYDRSSSVVSPAKAPDHVKHSLHSSSPKGGRDRDSLSSSKDYMGSSSKKESGSSKEGRGEDKGKVEKIKSEKVESEGQKPTMETTGPPPPPTNSYAYLHPSYLQPPPPHAFAHMPFEPAAMYRGGINPMIVSAAPHYANSPYALHPQIRYVAPPPELPVPQPHPADPSGKMHHPPGAKALDLLHQVSQQYTTTHKIHELAEHAIMSPTPAQQAASTPSSSAPSAATAVSAPSAVVSSGKGSGANSSSSDAVGVKGEGPRDTSRSPPTQRHLHTHHHTHVGVGYPIYDPYSVAAQKTYT